ncbi:hypothetical protein ACHAO8_004461 [Botrytis cinerea]
MITDGRFTNSSFLPGTTSSTTICIPPAFSPSYPTQLIQPLYSSALTPPTQHDRIHSRSFLPNQTTHLTSTPKDHFDIPTKVTFYTLFFIICIGVLTTLAYIFSYMCKRFVTKLQKRYEHESYGELQRLVSRRMVPGYLTFGGIPPCDAGGGGRPVSKTRSMENVEHSKAAKATKATKAAKAARAAKTTNATKATKTTKTAKATNDPNNESEWESALPIPNPRKIGWANPPRPIRRPPTTKKPSTLRFAVSPPRAPRPNLSNQPNPPNPSHPQKRLLSPPLSPSFLTISNATRAPMPIPGQEPSSWDAGIPWVTAADGLPILRDEGKLERAMSPNAAEWGDIDRLMRRQGEQYARDKKILDAARRREGCSGM